MPREFIQLISRNKTLFLIDPTKFETYRWLVQLYEKQESPGTFELPFDEEYIGSFIHGCHTHTDFATKKESLYYSEKTSLMKEVTSRFTYCRD